jgi:hypothetical protein
MPRSLKRRTEHENTASCRRLHGRDRWPGPGLPRTTEFPQALEQLEQSTISPERKKEIREQLSQGQSMHDDGHNQGDMSQMGGSLQILDEVLKEFGQ